MQNLFLAFVYNVAGVPLTAGVLYPDAGPPAQPGRRGTDHSAELGLSDQGRLAPADRALAGVTIRISWRNLRVIAHHNRDPVTWPSRPQGLKPDVTPNYTEDLFT